MKAGDKVIIISTDEPGVIKNIEGNVISILLDEPYLVCGHVYSRLRITTNINNLKSL